MLAALVEKEIISSDSLRFFRARVKTREKRTYIGYLRGRFLSVEPAPIEGAHVAGMVPRPWLPWPEGGFFLKSQLKR